MNNIVSILLQSSLSMSLLFMVYYAFLRKDTFFKTNRFYLIASLLLSLMIPFIDFSLLLPAREQVLLVLLDPVVITPDGIQASIHENNSIYQTGLVIYLTGVVIFTTRFVYQLVQLLMLVRKFGVTRKEGMRIVFTNKNFSPFSFFKLVFLNRTDVDSPESQKILTHESVHIRQWHSIDLIIIEIITIIQWFNPFIWFYRHAIKTLHEYLADEGVLHSGVDSKVYSALLFQQSTGMQINDLANNFSNSLIKKRFIMMTKKKTNPFARAKLLIALPLALSFMLVISFSPDMLAQEDEKSTPPQEGERLVTEHAPGDPPPPPKQPAAADKAVGSEKQPTIITIVEEPGGQDEPPIFTVVEVMPKYPGGADAMYKFFGDNIQYPQEAKENGISGKVYVQFVIEKDGKPGNFTILRGVEESLDKEAIRVLKMMPEWEPGTQRGKAVRVQYNLPIKFALDEKETEDK